MTQFDVSPDDMRALLRTKLFGPGSRRALVILEQPAIYGMFRMAQLLRDARPEEVRLFHAIEAAREWLGLE